MSTVTVPPSVVRVLREDLLRATPSAADLLCQLIAPGRLAEARGYQVASWRLDATRALLPRLAVLAPSRETGLELNLDEIAILAYEVAKSHYARELQRDNDLGRERTDASRTALEQFIKSQPGPCAGRSRRLARLSTALLDD